MDFKFGAASLACKSEAKVLPVAVTGDYKFRSKNLTARIGEPFSVEGMSVAEVNYELKERIANLIKENLKAGYGTEDEYIRAERYFQEKITVNNSDFLKED